MIFYLSFCDPDKPAGTKWLGGCYVESSDSLDAVRKSHLLGCNPGGEVLIVECPDHVSLREGFENRLLDKDEVSVAVGDKPGEYFTSADIADQLPRVCSACEKELCE